MKKRLFAICCVALACATVGLAAEDAKVFGKPVRVKGDGLGKSWAFWTYAIGGDWVVLSSRLGGDRLYDVSNISNPRYILNVAGCPGWNKYTMDKPIGGGRYLAHNGANHWIDWIDLQARPKPVFLGIIS